MLKTGYGKLSIDKGTAREGLGRGTEGAGAGAIFDDTAAGADGVFNDGIAG